MRYLNLDSLNRQAHAARRGEKYIPGCTGKVAYSSGAEATAAIIERRAKGARGKLTSYQCGHCRQWHLTSHPRKDK